MLSTTEHSSLCEGERGREGVREGEVGRERERGEGGGEGGSEGEKSKHYSYCTCISDTII